MPDKPKVTDEHLEKYHQIMGTPVVSKSAPPPVPIPSGNLKDSILAAIPKVSSISDKMFIFTGKKKIIIDGSEKQEQKVNTVNPGTFAPEPSTEPEPEEPEKPKEVKNDSKEPKPIPTEAPPPAKAPTVVIHKEAPQAKTDKKNEKPAKIAKVKIQVKSVPIPLTYAFCGIFLGAWTVFWLVFFGYVKL